MASERTTAADWFSNDYDFLQLCGDAQSQAKGEKNEEFAGEMMRNAKRYGLACNLSAPQLRWLCNLADHDIPQRRIPT